MTHEGTLSPVVLVIMDGWGYREAETANAIANAETPVIDALWSTHPHTLINASGKDVGLPQGQMGNSEVGHLNLGAGRVVPQELVRISDAFEDGSIRNNQELISLLDQVHQSQSTLHLMGLCSDGGVHSHINHLYGLVEFAKESKIDHICIHVITDGRDTNPNDGLEVVKALQAKLDEIGAGRIATVSGRYYAMDRDRRWDRIQLAYDVMTQPGEPDGRDAVQIVADSYGEDISDEFIKPVKVTSDVIKPGDGVIFYNFRPDRARQLCYAFLKDQFEGFEREKIDGLKFLTFTEYDASLPVQVAFKPQMLTNILGELVAKEGLKQLRTAETEKYPHVTYFFNGGLEQPFEGEDRVLIQSPMVPTYDRAPAMAADELTKTACAAIEKGVYSLIVLNYANPDMVGHTGYMDAAIQAIEKVDECVGKLVNSLGKVGGTMLITADHGNAEYMGDEHGNPWTAHTTNPVPFILVEGESRKIPGHGGEVKLRPSGGKLADIAPTILQILDLAQPPEMTGRSLIESSDYTVKPNQNPVKVAL